MNLNTKNIISTTQARKNLFSIVEDVATPDTFYTLTERGKAKAVIMSAEEFESWAETLELLYMFPSLKKDIKQSQKEFKEGKFVTLEELDKKHNLKNK
jgi:prevent-host-death family protein